MLGLKTFHAKNYIHDNLAPGHILVNKTRGSVQVNFISLSCVTKIADNKADEYENRRIKGREICILESIHLCS